MTIPTEPTPEAPDTAAEPTPATPASENTTTGSDAPETFSADHVRELRDDLAKRRIKQRETVESANERLLAAYVKADGRLVEGERPEITEDLLGEDGFIDPARVSESIESLITSKPYLAARKAAPIPQGVREDATETPSLFALMNAARR